MSVETNPPPRPSPARGEGDLTRVQVAAHHWRARFVANGIDVNDFDETVTKTTEWKDWGPNWRAVGEVHEQLGRDAEAHARTVSATEAYQRASWCYHLGKFLWFEDAAVHAELRDRSVAVYRKALADLNPRGLRREIPFEGHIIPANLRRPREPRRPPLILIVPGLDSSKEELFAIEEEFLRRGMATLTMDGPGQSENSVHFPIRPNWETVITPVIDEYDWVLIDCPPSMSIITLNGLRISDGFVIPTIPDHLSTYGIPQIRNNRAR